MVLALTLLLGAAPAGADVTLSGTVRSQGTPVAGADVTLFKRPGFQAVAGTLTAADGRYSLTVAPDVYGLLIDPLRGPIMPLFVEPIALSATMVRHFDLAQGVTLSGAVRDPGGQLVRWASVNLQGPALGDQSSFGNTRDTGRYSLGAPPGTYTILASAEGFVPRRIEGFVLGAAGATLNITMQTGRTIAGRVVNEAGEPVPHVAVAFDDPEATPGAEVFRSTDAEGKFTAAVPPGIWIVTADPLEPYQPVSVVVDTRSVDVRDLVLQVGAGPRPFVPGDPPRAALIRASAPDAAGLVTVTGGRARWRAAVTSSWSRSTAVTSRS
jgi:hypothetical protein